MLKKIFTSNKGSMKSLFLENPIEKRILVTGSEGFIGKEMYEYLQNEGHYVIGYDIKNYNDETDINYVSEIIEASNINTVMHFGAITSTLERDLHKILHYNYDFTRDLIDLCYDKDILLQFSSSASVYGDNNTTFKETDTPDPKNPYALSKFLCERYATKMIYDHGAKIQMFRYFNVYTRDYEKEKHKEGQASPYSRFRKNIKNNVPISLFVNSHNYLRDFVYVNRLIKVQYNFLDIEEDGVWNIGSGSCKSFEKVAVDIYNELRRDTWDIMNKNYYDIDFLKRNGCVKYISMPDDLKHSYQTYTCADLTKLNETLKQWNKNTH